MCKEGNTSNLTKHLSDRHQDLFIEYETTKHGRLGNKLSNQLGSWWDSDELLNYELHSVAVA